MKAYGKILLYGAYSIMEGGTGLVLNVDKGTGSTITRGEEAVIEIAEKKIYAKGRIQHNQLVLELKNPYLKYVESAVNQSLLQCNKISGFHLVLHNDPEMGGDRKFGLGSSATSTVATVASILSLERISDLNKIYDISQRAHIAAQDGLGSGFDISAACFGSQFFSRSGYEKFMLKGYDFFVAFTGRSSSTKVLASKVQEFKKRCPAEYGSFMQRYTDVNIRLTYEIKKGGDFLPLLEESWKMRKRLGELAGIEIESDSLTRFFTSLKEHGALAAGLLGAGGGDVFAVLCKDRKRVLENLGNFKVLDVKVGDYPLEF